MGRGLKPGEKPAEYLIRKGWVKTDSPDPWQWTKPPYPAQYRLQDAIDLQTALDR